MSRDPVDLRSDTITRPTPGMREAMSAAEVGDDVFGEDPSVNELQRRAAEIFGKEAALLVPSGTMANLLAVLVQTRPGETVLLAEGGHLYRYEAGGCGMVAGVLTRTVSAPHGILDPDLVRSNAVRIRDPHLSLTTLAVIENTMNTGGGSVYPLDTVRALGELTRELGIGIHCDGARIFNASTATGTPVRDYAAPCDTIMFCLSKGLGCPVGSVLLGDAETMDKAHRYRKMLGGGMRQAGVLAAAGLYALEHHVDRLAADHRRAAEFRAALADVPGLRFPSPSPTNMVYLEVDDAPVFAKLLEEEGVLCFDMGPSRIRAVFHLDVDDEGMDRAVRGFKAAAAKL